MLWIYRRIQSFQHAFRGLAWVLKHERNGKYHLAHVAGTIVLLPLTQAPLTITFAIVALGTECLNSGIERTVDVATSDYQKNARIAKDAASAAVLCVLFGSLLVDLTAIIDTIERLLP